MSKKIVRWCVVLLIAAGSSVFSETALPLPNPGFEEELTHWSDSSKEVRCEAVTEAAHSGALGLRVTDDSSTLGSSLRSAHIPVTAEKTYALRFWGRTVSGGGLGMYMDFFGADGTMLTTQSRHNQIILSIPDNATEWKDYTLVGTAPEGSATVAIWIHSFNGAKVTAHVDDIRLSELDAEEAKKMKSTQTTTSRHAFPIPDPDRIAAIATMLPAEPEGLGDPITERERWERLAELSAAESIIERADSYRGTEPPEVPDELYLEFSRTGNRTNYQRPYGQRSNRLNALVVAECLENEGRFLPAIERDVLAMCNERSWVMPAHDSSLTNFEGTHLTIDLGSSARAWLLATTHWWLEDRLSAAVLERIRREVCRRVLDVYLEAVRAGETRGNWWMRGTNNWNAVCTANVVGVSLALSEDKTERAEVLAAMEKSNPFFLSGFTDDGYCSEGIGYWNYGFGHFMQLGDIVLKATNGQLNIFADNPKLVRIASFPRNIMIQPGIAPAFADCGINARPSGYVLALIHRHIPEAIPDVVPYSPVSASVIHTGHFGFEENSFEVADAEPADLALPLRSYFENAGILISRAYRDAETDFSAAFKGGHNSEHHNHNDVGSYVLALDGSAYALDPGGEVYTRRTFSPQRYVSKMLNSYGHPVPIVAGKLQSKGGQARAEVLESEFTEDVDRFVLDIRQAYDVPELSTLQRTFENRRDEPAMVVEDRVAFTEPQEFGTALVTYERVHRREDGTLMLYDARGAVAVTVETEGAEFAYELEEIENPGRPSPKRLGFNSTTPIDQARIRFTFRPTALSGDLPGVYLDPEIGPGFQPDESKALKVEAEDFSGQEGGEVEVCEKVGASSGQSFRYWDDTGHSLSWEFRVPEAGRYAIQVRACHAWNGDVTRRVLIDGNPVGDPDKPILFPYTGGWSSRTDDWRTLYLSQKGAPLVMQLDAGVHRLTLVNDSDSGLNLDWIQLVPLQ